MGSRGRRERLPLLSDQRRRGSQRKKNGVCCGGESDYTCWLNRSSSKIALRIDEVRDESGKVQREIQIKPEQWNCWWNEKTG